MNDHHLEQWLRRARQQMAQGQLDGAIESLRQALSVAPDFADAHALLAICLLNKRRLHAAAHEAQLALVLEPESLLTQYAMAHVRLAQRQFAQAEQHIQQLLVLAPEEADYYRLLAQLYNLTGRRKDIPPLLDKARELDPDDPDTMVAYGEYYLSQRDLGRARQQAQEALHLQPEHHDALVLMGNVLLRNGEVAAAREHALWALRQHAGSTSALRLLAAVKVRSNVFLGLWWRYNTWMETLGDSRSIFVLLGAYVLYRVATLMASDFQQPELARIINILWLGIVAYTWFGPAMFRQALQKELSEVALRRDF